MSDATAPATIRSYETLLFAVEEDVATITLNRPESMNAMSSMMRRELAEALPRAANAARAVIVTGARNPAPGAKQAFCAGQDLADIRASDLEQILREEYGPMLDGLARCPVPTVCVVNGVAAGAGAHLAMCADITIAAESARFVEPFAKIGLIPAGAGSYWLPRLVGPARARGLCLLSEPIPAATAAAWGLIWESVPDDAVLARGQALASKLASGPTAAFKLTKEALGQSLSNDWENQLSLEAQLQGEASRTEDYAEGVAAFLEKRKPVFGGR